MNIEVLNNSIAYIKANHPDAAALLGEDVSFSKVAGTGKRLTPGSVLCNITVLTPVYRAIDIRTPASVYWK